MKPENLDKATKLVSQLDTVKQKLNAVEAEKDYQTKYDYISKDLYVYAGKEYLYLQDDKETGYKILDILIEKYSRQKTALLNEIETL